jgi:phosphatidylglycerophosphatase C
MVKTLNATHVLQRLERALAQFAGHEAPHGAPVVTFDGDGTLWTRDVGEQLFEAALEEQLLRDEATEALRAEARLFGISDAGSASEIGSRLYAGYRAGTYPERPATEMMVWCFAGWTPSEWLDFAKHTFETRGLAAHYYASIRPIVDWALGSGTRCFVISASPEPIVQVAVAPLGIASERVIAGRARVRERIEPALASPLPWAEGKVNSGRAVFGDAPWLAAFGDSAFDVAMLQAASVPVAVRPRPGLRERFSDVPGLIELMDESVA